VKIPSLILASALVGAGAASAVAAEPLAKADVPFAFEAGGTKFPAGHYEIVEPEDPSSGVLTVRNLDTQKEGFVEVLTRIAERGDHQSLLVFDNVGGQRMLSEIHVTGEDGYLLPAAGKRPHTHELVKAQAGRASKK
jgi:hypothetical protein